VAANCAWPIGSGQCSCNCLECRKADKVDERQREMSDISKTIHVINWKTRGQEPKTVCGLSRKGREVAPERPINITCNTCSLRILREGQRLGLVALKADEWEWRHLGVYYGDLVHAAERIYLRARP